MATLTGMSVDDLTADAKKWIADAGDPRWEKPYTELSTVRRRALPDTKVGAFPQALYDEAVKQGWVVISIKGEWKRVFAFDP
jgi:hypothetical protein